MPSKGAAKEESAKIARAFGVVSAATGASRVFGLLRDSLTAALFGASGVMDAFFVAYRLPNLFRALLAEGTLTTSFVPVYSEVLEKEGEEAAGKLGRVAFTALFLFLCFFVALGVVFAPFVIKLMGMGFYDSPEKFSLTVTLSRWLFPFIGMASLTALAGGILNARGIFLYPALAPVTLNAVIIAVTWLFYSATNPPVLALALGVLAGGTAQFVLQLFPLRSTGFRFYPDFDFGCAHLKKIILLAGPSIFGVAVYQINILV
ncbi:hypothetical protein FDZ71_04005 [bacterium]|nr:MAG: hypothetical protein FDZ71_04005 [bacterium]